LVLVSAISQNMDKWLLWFELRCVGRAFAAATTARIIVWPETFGSVGFEQ
jgi:hypothetical protein